MANKMKQAQEFLNKQRNEHMTDMLVYRRGDKTVELAATVGKTIFKVDNGHGVAVRIESRDYLINAADLILDGAAVEPEKGDEFIENGMIYEVSAPAKEPEWRWSDSFHTTYRIHTKYMGKDS
jgi:hypothetical protein